MTIQKIIKRHWRIIFLEVFLFIITVAALIVLTQGNDTVYIAAVIPDKGNESEKISAALAIYAERINKYGGINGSRLEIQQYLDLGTLQQAQKTAEEIVAEDKFIAVIGHFNQAATESAAQIYAEAGLPLLDPVSHIDTDSGSVFQLTPTPESYGVYMAHYIRKILNKQSVTIIHSDAQNDIDLTESFAQTFIQLGGDVENRLELQPHNEVSGTKFAEIVSEVGNRDNNMLLMAMRPEQAIALVVALRNSGFEVPVMITESDIGDNFSAYQEERQHPGYFTDGIYVPCATLFDALPDQIALVRKDYKQKNPGKNIGHTAMKAVMSASFIMQAFESLSYQSENIAEMRKQLEKKILENDWFNKDRQGGATNLFIGVFNRQQLVTAPINPTAVEYGDVEENSDKLLEIDGQRLYPTDIVYTGISMDKISEIDMQNLTYTLDFFLWFRYRDGVRGADDIEFLNALQSARLSDVLAETARLERSGKDRPDQAMTAFLVEFSSLNGESYRRYHITGRFKTAKPKNYALGQQNLYVRFRNHKANKFRLSYVSDFTNDNYGIYSLKNAELMKDADIEGLKFNLIDTPDLTLCYAFSYISDSDRTMLGNPVGFDELNNSSQFVAEYRVESILWSFRGIVSWINKEVSGREDQINLSLMIILLAVSCGIFILSLYGNHTRIQKKYSNSCWFLQLFTMLFILLFVELIASQVLYQCENSPWGSFHREEIGILMRNWVYVIGILWWIVPAYYITSAFDQFLWQPVQRKTGAEIPNVLRLSVTVIAYTLATLGIMAYVLQVTVKSLAATSGILAIIFAFASKIDLSNLMAGLGMSFAKVFKLGDWVKIDGVEGKVVEMTPRSTKILTFDSSIVNIPNSNVSNAVVENFTRPNPVYRLIIHMETVPIYRFERVEKVLLDAVASTENVLDTPKPFVLFKGQGDSCQIYEVAFFINDYSKRAVLWQATWRRIWRHLEQAGIEMATPQREVFLPKASEEDISAPLTVLNNCGACSSVSDEGKAQLAEKAKFCCYSAGEVLLRQGEADNNVFILTEGVVSFSSDYNYSDKNKRLGVGEIFGLDDLTADTTVFAKTDTEVMMIKKADFIAVTQDVLPE